MEDRKNQKLIIEMDLCVKWLFSDSMSRDVLMRRRVNQNFKTYITTKERLREPINKPSAKTALQLLRSGECTVVDRLYEGYRKVLFQEPKNLKN